MKQNVTDDECEELGRQNISLGFIEWNDEEVENRTNIIKNCFGKHLPELVVSSCLTYNLVGQLVF